MLKKMKFYVLVCLMLSVQAWGAGTLYLVQDNSGLFSVDTTTAALTPISNGPNYGMEGLALSGSSTQFYAVNNNNRLYLLDIDGTNAVFVTNITTSNADRGLTYNTTTGVLYGSDNSGFGSINTTTGVVTSLSNAGNDMEGLAADINLNVVYGLDNSEDLYRYNVGTNTWTFIGNTALNDGNDNGLAFDPTTNTLYAVESNGDLWSIDPLTASSTLIGNIGLGGGRDYGLAFLPATVSVPLSNSAKALLAILFAFGAFFMMNRRRVA